MVFTLEIVKKLLANSSRGPRTIIGGVRHGVGEGAIATKTECCRARSSSHPRQQHSQIQSPATESKLIFGPILRNFKEKCFFISDNGTVALPNMPEHSEFEAHLP